MAKTIWKLPSFLVYMLALQAIVCIVLVLDIPIARQVLGFLYLTFVLGFILLKGLRLENSDSSETVLFSVGLSITFLMFTGLLINESGSSNLISKPLSTEPLIIIISIVVTLMCILSYLANRKDFNIINIKDLIRSPVAILLLAIPLLSVIGVFLTTAFRNNLLLISVIILVSILFLLLLLSSKSSSYYPLAIVSIALALLLSTTLTSKYMYGYDINLEFNVFTATRNVSYWNRHFYIFRDQSIYNSMTSITILPTIFSNLLNIEGSLVFKIIFPVLFSLVPLGLYHLYQIQWNKKVAFMSVIFFMANYEFSNVLITTAKTMIGEFFYVLLFLVLLKKDATKSISKWIIVVFFIFALVVSHYATNYIFLFLILSTWLLGKAFLKNKDMRINYVTVAFSFCLTFLWYMFITAGPFYAMINNLRSNFGKFLEEFFNFESRGNVVIQSLGLLQPPSFLHTVAGYIHHVTEFFILIGFISLLAKWKRERLDSEYNIIACLNMGFIFLAIVAPRFAEILEMGRLYEISLLFLSPLFVLGGETLFARILSLKKGGNLLKKQTYCFILVSIVIVVFFFFQSGLIYEISGDPQPSSISLSLHKMGDSFSLIHECDVFGATWLSKYGDVENTRTYSDTVSFYHVLTSHSTINRNMITIISNTTTINSASYIYFCQFNVLKGIMTYNTQRGIHYNMSELHIFNGTTVLNNKVYSNGACEVHHSIPK